MNSTQLEYFLNVSRTGSFTRAAETFYISQPALSKQIRLLEEELGAELFIRQSRGVRLTPAGRKLFVQADEIIRRMRDIPLAVKDLQDDVSGELNIVCGTYLSRRIIPDLLTRLLERYPSICPRIRETPAREHPAVLLDGSADIGIGCIFQHSEALTYQTLFTSRIVLIRSAQSPLAKRKRLCKEEIAEQKMICYPFGSAMYDVICRALYPCKPNVFVDSRYSGTIIEFVRQNLGLALVPDYLIEPEKRSGLVVGGFDCPQELAISCHYCRDRVLTPQAKAFIEVINERFATTTDIT